jgi:nicotinate-nucleotide adenylyltransferase
MMRIGIFGGTFDPPHVGHLILAAESRDQFMLDRLLWVITPVPPHKLERQDITPLAHRLEMVRLMLEREGCCEISRVEIDRPGPHYAVDTVSLLCKQFPGADLYYLMGGDSLKDLPSWKDAKRLVNLLAGFAVMGRPGARVDLAGLELLLPGIQKKVVFIDAPLLEISSSHIRERISLGRQFRHFLTPPVWEYILSNNLYR